MTWLCLQANRPIGSQQGWGSQCSRFLGAGSKDGVERGLVAPKFDQPLAQRFEQGDGRLGQAPA